MNDSLTFGKAMKKRLSSGERVKFAILGNRLSFSNEEAKNLLDDLHQETAKVFSIPETAVRVDVDFFGRDFDLVFTINKQNTPRNKA